MNRILPNSAPKDQSVRKIHSPHPFVAIFFVLLATFMMAAQDAIVKSVSSALSLWQIFTLRSLITTVILLIMLTGANREKHRVRLLKPGWAIVRAALMVAMYVSFYAALPFLQLSVVAAAYYTGPIFITLLSILLLGERVGLGLFVGLIFGFLGVLVIVQPGTDAFSSAMLIPIASAIFYAFAMVVTRGRCSEESPLALSLVLNLCFIICGLGMSGLILVIEIQPTIVSAAPFLLGLWAPMGVWEWSIIGLLGALSLVVHLALARAYQIGPAPVVATFDYSYLVFAVFWGVALLSETPSRTTLLGMGLIAIAGIIVMLTRRPTRLAIHPPNQDASSGPSHSE